MFDSFQGLVSQKTKYSVLKVCFCIDSRQQLKELTQKECCMLLKLMLKPKSVISNEICVE